MDLNTAQISHPVTPHFEPDQLQLDIALEEVRFSKSDVVCAVLEATSWGSARVGLSLEQRPVQVYTMLTIKDDTADLTICLLETDRQPGSTARPLPFSAALKTSGGQVLSSIRDRSVSPTVASIAVIRLTDPDQLTDGLLRLVY